MKETDKRLFLIDAMALVYRSYFALMSSPRMTTTGKNTNAQFGFTNAILDLIKNQNPTHVAVVWDAPGPTKRHEIFEDYKANRLEVPEDIRAAIPDIKKITSAFNFPNIELTGYEADDIIGAMAFKASEQGIRIRGLSGWVKLQFTGMLSPYLVLPPQSQLRTLLAKRRMFYR